jgi:hypothetical protein
MDATLEQLVTDYTAYAKGTENDFLIRVALEFRSLAHENVELRNKLWSTQRAWHNYDPFESEEEDA